MKKILCLIVAFSVVAAVLTGRAKIAAEMDRRELWYDADGDFIMLDTSNDMIGFYHAVKPLTHVWARAHIDPGVYIAEIASDGRITVLGEAVKLSIAGRNWVRDNWGAGRYRMLIY